MEEQREESEFVGDFKEPMEEAAGKRVASKTQTLDDDEVDVPKKEVELNSVSDDFASGEDMVGSGSGEESSEKNISIDDVERTETEVNKMEFEGDVVVKPVDERDGSEICEDVQRVSKIVNVVEVEMNDEMAKCEVKSQNGEIAGEEDNVTSAGENEVTDDKAQRPLPTDLINEIFSRLPAKSVGRFRILSKQWCSVLSSPDFIESRSCARPRLLFAVERKGVRSFFSSPQSSSSLVVNAEFHSRSSEDVSRFMTPSYASGLFYFKYLWIPNVGTVTVVCNPTTGQYVRLSGVEMYRKSRGFIGFDPIGKKFKVLAEAYPFCSNGDHHEVLTLGTGESSWRKKKTDCPGYDHSLSEGICIDGVIYYFVDNFNDTRGNVVCFDLRSEEFKLVFAECFSDPKTTKMINYKGKLGGIECSYGEAGGSYTLELRLCVLEDAERHEWWTNVYTLPENKLIDDPSNVSVAGMTARGEIVLTMDYTCKPYYVFYFNPKKNALQSVEIQGFGAFEAIEYRGRVTAFVDHVEHLDVEKMKHSRVKHFCTTCVGEGKHLHVEDSKLPAESNIDIFANQVKRFCCNCEEQEKTK